MLFRLVRPMRRFGSRNRYYVKRIPSDVRRKVTGTTLAIPIGGITQSLTITPRTQAIRVSLRTDEPAEVKARQAAVDAYLENVWQAHRENEPVALTHRQATALAGEFYRACAGGEGRETTISMEHIPGVGWQRVEDEHLEPEVWEAVVESFTDRGGDPQAGRPARPFLENPDSTSTFAEIDGAKEEAQKGNTLAGVPNAGRRLGVAWADLCSGRGGAVDEADAVKHAAVQYQIPAALQNRIVARPWE